MHQIRRPPCGVRRVGSKSKQFQVHSIPGDDPSPSPSQCGQFFELTAWGVHNLHNVCVFNGMLRAKRPQSGVTSRKGVCVCKSPPWRAFVQSVLQCQSAPQTGDCWCLPKPLGSSPGAPGESLEESFLGHVEPLFWSQSFVQKMPVLGAERPSVPELLWVLVETMFGIVLNNDVSCLLKGWACKVAEFTR